MSSFSHNFISEFKKTICISIPIIVAEGIHAVSSFAAVIMIAHLGKEQLAANAISWSIYITTLVLFLGMLSSVSIIVAQSFGANDLKGVAICLQQGLIIAIISAVPMMLILWFSPIFLTYIKQDQLVINCAKPFLHALCWSILPTNIMLVIQQFFIGMNRVKIVIYMSCFALLLELFFYYVFIFGKFNLPQFGLAGIGYGLTLTYSILVIFFVSYSYLSKKSSCYCSFKQKWQINGKFLLEIICIGVPIGLMYFSEEAFFVVVAMMMGYLGVTTLAAYQIAYQYLIIAMIVLFAINQSVSVQVSTAVGKGNRNNLRLVMGANIMWGFILISIVNIFYISFPSTIVQLDIDINSLAFKEVAIQAIKFLPLVGIILFVDSLRLVSCGALRGLKDSRFQMWSSICGFWLISFPLAYLLSFKLGIGGLGIFYGIIIGFLTVAVSLLVRFNKLSKKVNLELLVTKS